MPNKKKIIITGTHIAPAIELISQLKKDKTTSYTIHYIGRQYTSPVEKIPAVEYEIIPQMVDKYHIIDCGKLDRRYWPNTIAGIPKTIKGIIQSFFLIKKIRPDVTVSFGGYLSVPVIISSAFFKVPSITHEQTQTTSLSTKINSFFATKIALSFDNCQQLKSLPATKTVVTGNLLRHQIFENKSKLFPEIQKNKLPTIYITAGNQGSKKINDTIISLLPELSKDFNIIHQTGKYDYENVASKTKSFENYYACDYISPDDIGFIFHHADIIISRSGANITQEIAVFGHKTILIPLPVSQQNEQELNALWLKQQYPSKVIIIQDKDLNSRLLLQTIKDLSLIDNKINHHNLGPNYKLLDLIHEIN